MAGCLSVDVTRTGNFRHILSEVASHCVFDVAYRTFLDPIVLQIRHYSHKKALLTVSINENVFL